MDRNPRPVEGSRERGDDAPADEWSIVNPAVRALLDHVAEELAAEFVRLMKRSVSEDPETRESQEAKR
jgi:hypothetical protein